MNQMVAALLLLVIGFGIGAVAGTTLWPHDEPNAIVTFAGTEERGGLWYNVLRWNVGGIVEEQHWETGEPGNFLQLAGSGGMWTNTRGEYKRATTPTCFYEARIGDALPDGCP